MTLSDAVGAAVAVLRRRPADILPWYLLGAAVPAIARVIPFLAIAVGYAYLAVTGRLETIRALLADIDTDPPDPNAEPEAFGEWLTELEPVAEQLATPELIALALVTLGLTLLVTVLLNAVVAAGQLSACHARLRDGRGLIAGIEGARRYWLDRKSVV